MPEQEESQSLTHLASMLYNTPLAIHPDKAAMIEQIFRRKLNGESIAPASGDGASLVKASEPGRPGLRSLAFRHAPDADRPFWLTEGGTAVIPVIGTLVQRAGWLDAMSGMVSYGTINHRLRAAVDASDVKGIITEIDSPGGSVSGLFNLLDNIKQYSKAKPIWSNVNEEAYSAAYAIASTTKKICATRTAMLGSIGVIALHVDQSRYDREKGFRYEYVYAGARKKDYNPHEAMSDAVRERLQAIINDRYEMFVSHVANTRPMSSQAVRNTEAGIFTIQESVNRGMADSISNLDETVERLESTYSNRTTVSLPSRASAHSTKEANMTMEILSSSNNTSDTINNDAAQTPISPNSHRRDRTVASKNDWDKAVAKLGGKSKPAAHQSSWDAVVSRYNSRPDLEGQLIASSNGLDKEVKTHSAQMSTATKKNSWDVVIARLGGK